MLGVSVCLLKYLGRGPFYDCSEGAVLSLTFLFINNGPLNV